MRDEIAQGIGLVEMALLSQTASCVVEYTREKASVCVLTLRNQLPQWQPERHLE